MSTIVIPGFHIQFGKAVEDGKERLVTLGKVEADQMSDVLTEKTTARNGTHSDMLCQPFAEMQVVFHAIFRYVEHDVISSLGLLFEFLSQPMCKP